MLGHDQLRLAACLAHTAPGVTIALLADDRHGLPRFADVVSDATITAGLHHLGGGLFERRTDEHDERWFATLIDHERVGRILAGNELGLPAHAVDVRLLPDPELGVTAVRIVCDGAFAGCVDEVSSWALAACMVDELLTDLHPNPTKTRNHP